MPGKVLDVAKLRKLYQDSTKGPFSVEMSDGYITGHITSPHHDYYGNTVFSPDSMIVADAIYVVEVLNDMPSIIELLEQLERLKNAR